MSQETPKIDNKLVNKFDELIQEEGRKIEPEEQIKKALWAFDSLKQENKINFETTLEKLIQVIEDRKRELRQTMAYAKDVAESPATDEVGIGLHGIAKEEAETAKRLLGYMEAAWSLLMPMKMSMGDYYSEISLGDVQNKLRKDLSAKEDQTDLEEKQKRGGSRS